MNRAAQRLADSLRANADYHPARHVYLTTWPRARLSIYIDGPAYNRRTFLALVDEGVIEPEHRYGPGDWEGWLRYDAGRPYVVVAHEPASTS
jgi:hypothetical protein